MRFCALAVLCVLVLMCGGWTQPPEKEVADDVAVETFLYFLVPNDEEDELVVRSCLEAHGLKEETEELIGKARKLAEWRKEQHAKAKRGDSQVRLKKDRDDYIDNEVREFKSKTKLEEFLPYLKKHTNNNNKEVANETVADACSTCAAR